MINDLTSGQPGKVLRRFAFPMLGSVAFQQLYNVADSVIAGRFIGDNALAAVGASYPITMIFVAVATGMNAGCTVVISQLFGAKQLSRMKTAVWTSAITSVVMSLILFIVGFFGCGWLLDILKTPSDIFVDSASYLKIYTAGLIFVFVYNISNGIFNALGDSATPFYFLVASSVGNIIMNIIFVTKFNMGVPGLAWATLICQAIAAVCAFSVVVNRLKKIKTDTYKKFSFRMLGNISKMSVPCILQQSFVSVGNLFVQRAVNPYSSSVVAGYAAAVKLNTFAITLFSTISNSLSAFSAQNIGAGNMERVHKGLYAGLKLALAIIVPFTLVYFFFGDKAMLLFVDSKSTEVIRVGQTFLRIVSPFYLVVAAKLVCDGILHGGAAVKHFMTSTFTDLILRVIGAFAMPAIVGSSTGIWWAWPIGWVTACILSVTFYKKGVWKQNKLIG